MALNKRDLSGIAPCDPTSSQLGMLNQGTTHVSMLEAQVTSLWCMLMICSCLDQSSGLQMKRRNLPEALQCMTWGNVMLDVGRGLGANSMVSSPGEVSG